MATGGAPTTDPKKDDALVPAPGSTDAPKGGDDKPAPTFTPGLDATKAAAANSAAAKPAAAPPRTKTKCCVLM